MILKWDASWIDVSSLCSKAMRRENEVISYLRISWIQTKDHYKSRNQAKEEENFAWGVGTESHVWNQRILYKKLIN